MTKIELVLVNIFKWLFAITIFNIAAVVFSFMAKQLELTNVLSYSMGISCLLGCFVLGAIVISREKHRVKHPYGVQGVYK